MATSSRPTSRKSPKCCLCLTRSENVITLPCAHDYCRTCSSGLMSTYERTGWNSCPECSQTFYTEPDGHVDKVRDELVKIDLCSETSEDTLAGASVSISTKPDRDSTVDKLKKTALHAQESCSSYTQTRANSITGPEDVPCDACAESRQKALKSCLVCQASYCDTHLQLHNDLHARAGHILVDATNQLQAMTCSVHGKVLDVYCRKEKRRICYMCVLEDHKGHDVVAAGQAEREVLRKSKLMITGQEKQLKELRLAKNTLRYIAKATEEESELLFTELIHSIKSSQSEMKLLIRAQERAELNRIEELMEQVEEEITELKWSDAEMEQNDIHLLQMTVHPQFSFGEMVKSLSALKGRIDVVWRREIEQISAAVMKDRIVVPTEPRTRKDFLQYLVPLSVDPDTAHQSLSMCEEKGVVCSTECQAYPDQPERFDWWAQVLCREPLTAHCYWEAEWTGLHGVDIAVSYRDIQRKGDNDECSFGYNKQSWSLDCAIVKYAFAHDKVEKEISAPVSHRIGVYLDYKAGVLSFYSVSDCMTLLHREETRFTQPLYAGFGLYEGSTVRICQPDIEAMEKIPEES
ncbi:tripartite motif-containing protein 16 isoform X2 [Hemibagrus wyckioides]|uniref:tripartite motif-containing protein 16 isoform X2 n=1 Tax=Hemibagrus wyckioides TaxID=337641 RepID=UPI00266BB81D|nr:tripartite motif-containing protein 16 isoform X2 [Hemibagrus wyckioides]